MATLKTAKRIAIKVGSALLVDRATGALRGNWLQSLACDVASLKGQGADVILISSGSIGLGRVVLNLTQPELVLEQSQAAAAVGQIRLARAYEDALSLHGLTTAQVLVTLEDSTDRRRYLNTRATLETLLTLGVIPIVNENDTVATDEIRYGDNDRLAAQIAVTTGADLLILLSDIDGFYNANPADNPSARRFETISEITPEIEKMAGDAGSGLSKGGMKTKLMAARMATSAGCAMIIAKGTINNPLKSLDNGAPSTLFPALLTPQAARKRWIAAMKPKGTITIDAGAALALNSGKSLLPAGVTDARGTFGRGDPVEILSQENHTLGLGLTRYTSDESNAIKGAKSNQIESILGYPGRSTLIHRDDMAL